MYTLSEQLLLYYFTDIHGVSPYKVYGNKTLINYLSYLEGP